jgi:hypothetical protein
MVPKEVADRALGGVPNNEEDDEDNGSNDESVQSIDKWHVEPFDMTTMPAPLSHSELSKRIVKEAKHYEIDLDWLCCLSSMIPTIKPILKEYDEDDDEIERQDIDHDNQQEQWHVKKSNVERLTKIAKLCNLPPCPWLDKNGEFKSSWTTMSGVEMEVMSSLSKESPENHQLHKMFLNRLDKMRSYTLPRQMRAFLLDMRAHIEPERNRSWIVSLIRKKFTPRQLNVIVNPDDILPYKIPYTRANWDQFEELAEIIPETPETKTPSLLSQRHCRKVYQAPSRQKDRFSP